jgi:hypothetical protein
MIRCGTSRWTGTRRARSDVVAVDYHIDSKVRRCGRAASSARPLRDPQSRRAQPDGRSQPGGRRRHGPRTPYRPRTARHPGRRSARLAPPSPPPSATCSRWRNTRSATEQIDGSGAGIAANPTHRTTHGIPRGEPGLWACPGPVRTLACHLHGLSVRVRERRNWSSPFSSTSAGVRHPENTAISRR